MTKQLTCTIPALSNRTDIEIRSDLLEDSDFLFDYFSTWNVHLVIITDHSLASIYGEKLKSTLLAKGLKVSLFSFPSGEEHKSRKTKEHLEDQMLGAGLGRDTGVLALGGGVVTDVAGYVAATYCRGLPLAMIPTSLLGMVDSSLGGKLGVNVPQGKNLIGAIYQPRIVLIDPSLLRSLPMKDLRSGVMEMIKHGLIADAAYFDYLESHSTDVLQVESAVMEQVIYDSCRIKAQIVEEDEKETGKRRLLNFGHTIGHALENLSHYSMSHGEAVAIGILVESYIAVQMGYLSAGSFERILHIFKMYGFTLRLPQHYVAEAVYAAMRMDKKSIQGTPRFVLLAEIGSPLPFHSSYCTQIDEKLLFQALKWMNHDLCCD